MGDFGRFGWGVALLILIVGSVGCGGGSSTGTEETKEVLYPRVKGPSREFLIPGGDNIVQFFGEEATAAERAQASRVIHAWTRARVAKNWAVDCRYLSREYKKVLVNDANAVTEGRVKSCPQALDYFGPLASGKPVNTLTGPIDSLRVREDEAFAQYHGRAGIDWIVPMDREGGKWLVANSTPIDRTK